MPLNIWIPAGLEITKRYAWTWLSLLCYFHALPAACYDRSGW